MTAPALTPRQTPITVGETAPDFTLPDQSRSDWSLAQALKRGDVVLSFYPMDFSPVCSTEMKCVTHELARFSSKNATVVGISCDSFYVHKAWAESMGLSHTLLADMHRAVCRAYGFYFAPLNVASRGTVVIAGSPDGVGKVKWVQARELKDALKTDDLLAAIS
ncbi:MAG: redoxin domain-containing protein [Planctomycetota bacterium]|nr:redoxin domain-containing protein [Planctomycetota bacterium]